MVVPGRVADHEHHGGFGEERLAGLRGEVGAGAEGEAVGAGVDARPLGEQVAHAPIGVGHALGERHPAAFGHAHVESDRHTASGLAGP